MVFTRKAHEKTAEYFVTSLSVSYYYLNLLIVQANRLLMSGLTEMKVSSIICFDNLPETAN